MPSTADEAGDTGRKFAAGSSPFFVVALVVFPSREAADKCNVAIDALRSELRVSERLEFRCSDNADPIREAFLKCVCAHDFTYNAFVIDKRLPGTEPPRGVDMYSWALGEAVMDSGIENESLVVDQFGNKPLRGRVAAYLRQLPNTESGARPLSDFRQARSAGNNLIQLADYAASLTNRVAVEDPRAIRLQRATLAAHAARVHYWPDGNIEEAVEEEVVVRTGR